MKSFRSFLIGPGLLTCSFIFHTGLLAQEAPDSIVQLTAEAQGLEPIAPENLPPFGTFWVVGSNGCAAPYPCLPKDSDPIFPIYAMADGQYLVDGTDGQVSLNPRQTNATVAAALAAQAATVVALIDQVQTPPIQRRAQTMALGGGPTPPGAGGSGTNVYYPNGGSYTPPDYGTNLWIAQVWLTNRWLAGVASNTVAGTTYEVLESGEVGGTNWISTGLLLLGAETTNWTALPLLPVGATNQFFRLRSLAEDANQLPIWWEQTYGVTDPYGNPAGDGWNNLYKAQHGLNPNVFYTPAAPQGLAVAYHSVNGAANLHWLPAAGAVMGYTVRDSSGHTFNVSANTTALSQTVPYALDFSYGGSGDPTVPLSYQVQAHYAGGDSAWSPSVPLQPATVWGRIVPAPGGGNWLVVAGLPANAVAVRVFQFFDGTYLADNQLNPFVIVTNLDLPVNGFTNGLCSVTSGAFQPALPPDPIGFTNHNFYLQAVDAAGNVSGGSPLGESWEPAPFADGRVQLKQNCWLFTSCFCVFTNQLRLCRFL
jgi:hypothetical protein